MLNEHGMIIGTDGQERPGKVLASWLLIRRKVGVFKKELKKGMSFKTLSAEMVIDKVRALANKEGLLIVPVESTGTTLPVERGTLAAVNQKFKIQSVEDGSYIYIASFGVGADTQDKAGGKANTYSLKTALVQALLAGGEKDTDDEQDPIPGGITKAKPAGEVPKVDDVKALFDLAQDKVEYKAAMSLARKLGEDDQREVANNQRAAKARVEGTNG